MHAILTHGYLWTVEAGTPGAKAVTFTPAPEAEEGYHAEPIWEEKETEITQTWGIIEDPDDIDEAEAFDIIFGGGE